MPVSPFVKVSHSAVKKIQLSYAEKGAFFGREGLDFRFAFVYN